jgi:hypothetical protein
MKKVTKLALALVAVGSVASAAITLNFNTTTTSQLNVGNGATITLGFTVDGLGVVALDASTTSTDTTAIANVNAWDSSNVGTVDHASLNGTSFSLLMTPDSDVSPTGFRFDGRYGTGMIGIGGNNSSRIDGADSDKERVIVSLASGSPIISLTNFSWDFASTATGLVDARVKDGDSTQDFYDMVESGTSTRTLASIHGTQTVAGGLTIGSGADALVFTSGLTTDPTPFSHGYGLSGMTLNVIPEPATIGMIGLGAIATLMVRRFRNRA